MSRNPRALSSNPAPPETLSTAAGGAPGGQGHDENYGLERRKGNAWCVWLKRQGHLIYRRFADADFGSSEAAYALARAYRDAVLKVLPPVTNRDIAVRLRKTNTSGISGVRYVETADGGAWDGTLQTGEILKMKLFKIARYGEAEARARAIAQREEWLAEMPMSFLTLRPYSETVAHRHFAARLEPETDVQPRELLSKTELAEKLAKIDAQFAAFRPPPKRRLQVSFKAQKGEILHVYVSHAEQRGRALQTTVMYRRRSFPEAKALAVRMEALIAELYTADVAHWFMAEHGNGLLDQKHFDPETGFSLCVVVPDKLAAAWRKTSGPDG
jgi:hypothetical protein